MVTGVSPAVATPVMSLDVSPQSFIALSAASAWSPICETLGMRPNSVVSAAPTMAIAFGFMTSAFRRTEEREGDLVVDLLKGDLERHVELQGFRRLRATGDVGHHPRTLVQFDDGDRIGRVKTRRRAVMNDIGIEPPL